VSFAAITLLVASQRVFIVVSVYFFIDSVRKLLDRPSYVVQLPASLETVASLVCPNTAVRFVKTMNIGWSI
jgi:hypothetical protein